MPRQMSRLRSLDSNTQATNDSTSGEEVPEFKRAANLLGPDANLTSAERLIENATVHQVKPVEIERKFIQQLRHESSKDQVWADPDECEVCNGATSIDDADVSPPDYGREVVHEYPDQNTHEIRECGVCGGTGRTSCSRCNGRGTRTVSKEKPVKSDGEQIGVVEDETTKTCSCRNGRTGCGNCRSTGERHVYTVVTHRYFPEATEYECTDAAFPGPDAGVGVRTTAHKAVIDADGWETKTYEELPDGTSPSANEGETQGLQTEAVTQVLSATKLEYTVFGSRHTAFLVHGGAGVVCTETEYPHRPLEDTKMAERARDAQSGRNWISYLGYSLVIISGLQLMIWFDETTPLTSLPSVVISSLLIYLGCRYLVPKISVIVNSR